MTDLLINNVFWTFQGEGANAGRRALFIRLPKCNLRCSWCDTEFDSYTKWDVEALRAVMLSEPSKFAVITGGEPLMNKQLPRVIKLLKDEGFEIACETNGTWPYVEGIDFVTCSPKRDANYEVDEGLWSHVSEFKYVVDQGFNFSILDRHKNRSDTVRLSLSPEFGNWKDSLSAIFDYITLHPRWRISLQTHKIMEIP